MHKNEQIRSKMKQPGANKKLKNSQNGPKKSQNQLNKWQQSHKSSIQENVGKHFKHKGQFGPICLHLLSKDLRILGASNCAIFRFHRKYIIEKSHIEKFLSDNPSESRAHRERR